MAYGCQLSQSVFHYFLNGEKLSQKTKHRDPVDLANKVRATGILRIFCTSILLVLSTFLFASFSPFFPLGFDTHGLLFVLVAFKIWLEYSLIRWGKLVV